MATNDGSTAPDSGSERIDRDPGAFLQARKFKSGIAWRITKLPVPQPSPQTPSSQDGWSRYRFDKAQGGVHCPRSAAPERTIVEPVFSSPADLARAPSSGSARFVIRLFDRTGLLPDAIDSTQKGTNDLTKVQPIFNMV